MCVPHGVVIDNSDAPDVTITDLLNATFTVIPSCSITNRRCNLAFFARSVDAPIRFAKKVATKCDLIASGGTGKRRMTSAELVDCKSLLRGSLIDVETKSRHYRIECLGGNAIRISGHPEYCPDPVPAQLHGSVDKEGVLELGLIGRGMRLIFLLNERRPVTTSRVLRVHVDQPKVVQPKSSPSIH